MPIQHGFFKQKGGVWTITPERWNQIPVKNLNLWSIQRLDIIGYVAINGNFWVVASIEGSYLRIFFAKSQVWFDAYTSEPEMMFIKHLPQIYVVAFG